MRLLPPDPEPSMLVCFLALGGLIGLCLLVGSLALLTGHGQWFWPNEELPSMVKAWEMLGGAIFFLGIGIATWFLWGRHEESADDTPYSKWD